MRAMHTKPPRKMLIVKNEHLICFQGGRSIFIMHLILQHYNNKKLLETKYTHYTSITKYYY